LCAREHVFWGQRFRAGPIWLYWVVFPGGLSEIAWSHLAGLVHWGLFFLVNPAEAGSVVERGDMSAPERSDTLRFGRMVLGLGVVGR